MPVCAATGALIPDSRWHLLKAPTGALRKSLWTTSPLPVLEKAFEILWFIIRPAHAHKVRDHLTRLALTIFMHILDAPCLSSTFQAMTMRTLLPIASNSKPGIQGRHNAIEPFADNQIREVCLLYTSPSPRDKRQSRMPSSA